MVVPEKRELFPWECNMYIFMHNYWCIKLKKAAALTAQANPWIVAQFWCVCPALTAFSNSKLSVLQFWRCANSLYSSLCSKSHPFNQTAKWLLPPSFPHSNIRFSGNVGYDWKQISERTNQSFPSVTTSPLPLASLPSPSSSNAELSTSYS